MRLCDRRLLPHSIRDLRSSGILLSVLSKFLTGVSVEPICPIFKRKEIQQESFLLEYVNDAVPKRRQGIAIMHGVMFQNSADIKYMFHFRLTLMFEAFIALINILLTTFEMRAETYMDVRV
jgi:hypothetical protein